MIYENYNIILPATEKTRKSLESSNKAEDNQINTKNCRSETIKKPLFRTNAIIRENNRKNQRSRSSQRKRSTFAIDDSIVKRLRVICLPVPLTRNIYHQC